MATSRIIEIPFSRLSVREREDMEMRSSVNQEPYQVLRTKTKRLSNWLGITEAEAEVMILDNDPLDRD